MKLSVIIPIYNEVESIKTIIQRVQATRRAHEIILVDDGSKDGSLGGITLREKDQTPRCV